MPHLCELCDSYTCWFLIPNPYCGLWEVVMVVCIPPNHVFGSNILTTSYWKHLFPLDFV